MPFCGLIPPQASCDLFFLDLKRGARVLFVLHLKSVKSKIVVRPYSSSMISLKRGARARCSSLERVFTLIRYNFCCHNHDAFTTAFTYVKRSFWLFVVHMCKIWQQLSAVWRFGLPMKYRHSFATVIPLNHEISQVHCNKPRSKHGAITVKSRQIHHSKHSYYGVKKCKSWVSLKIS